jgi:microcompartment protein CcmK/EutM
MTLHKNSNLSGCRLMLIMLMDRSGNTELLHRPACDGMASGPELITLGFYLPRRRT